MRPSDWFRPTNNLGRYVIDEVPCAIVAIRFVQGEMVIYAEAHGSHKVDEGAAAQLFGPDGVMVLSVPSRGHHKIAESVDGTIYVVQKVRLS